MSVPCFRLKMSLTQYWVEILLIDSNERTSCFSTELLHLPDKFQCFPPQAVDIRIGWYISPQDFSLLVCM